MCVTLSWLTGKLEQNRALVNVIPNTFPTITSQNVYGEKGPIILTVM